MNHKTLPPHPSLQEVQHYQVVLEVPVYIEDMRIKVCFYINSASQFHFSKYYLTGILLYSLYKQSYNFSSFICVVS